MRRLGIGIVGMLVVAAGCATSKPAVSTATAQPVPLRRLRVLPVGGDGGPALAHELVRALLAEGFQVTERAGEAQAALAADLLETKPVNKRIVLLGQISTTTVTGEDVQISNPVIAEAGWDWPGSMRPKSQMVTTYASVRAQVRLLSADATRSLWVNVASYEGVDVPTAEQALARLLIRPLRQAVVSGPKKP